MTFRRVNIIMLKKRYGKKRKEKEKNNGEELPLHGTISNTPCENIAHCRQVMNNKQCKSWIYPFFLK